MTVKSNFYVLAQLFTFLVGVSWVKLGMAQEPVKVFIYAGQSNAQGRSFGISRQEFPKSPYDAQIRYAWNIARARVVLDRGWDTLQAVQLNNSRKCHAGEISFGRVLAEKEGSDIALIKVARSGTNMDKNWNSNVPEFTTEKGEGNGALYWMMVQFVKFKLAELEAAGIPYTLEGLLFHQGEADTRSHLAERYRDNLQGFVDSLRIHLDPNIHIFLASIYNPSRNQEDVQTVRDAQISVAQERDFVHFVNLDTIVFDSAGQLNTIHMNQDGLHYKTPGYLKVGEAFAQAYLAHAQGMACMVNPEMELLPDIDFSIIPLESGSHSIANLKFLGETEGWEFSLDNGVSFQRATTFFNLPPGVYPLVLRRQELGNCVILRSPDSLIISDPPLTYSKAVFGATPKPKRRLITSIYPNPFSHSVEVDWTIESDSDTYVELFDQRGRALGKFCVPTQQSISLGEELKPGIYFIRIRSGNEFHVEKVVKSP